MFNQDKFLSIAIGQNSKKAAFQKKTRESKKPTIDPNLPDEVLTLILFSYPPETILEMKYSEIDSVKKATLNNGLWANKFEQHFPHLLAQFVDEQNINWYEAFWESYRKEYENLPENHRDLFSLVKEGNVEKLKQKSIQFGDLLEIQDQSGISLLEWAQKKHYQPVLDYFFEIAKKHYLTQANEFDLTKTDNQGRTILHWAAACHQTNIMQSLIGKINNIDITDNNGCSPLFYAIAHNGIFEMLVNKGASIAAVNSAGDNLLHYAAKYGDENRITFLIEKGVTLNRFGSLGYNPLHVAAHYGHGGIVQILLNKISFDTPSKKGDNVLHIAAKCGHVSIIKTLLLNNDAKINLASESGYFPLHYAAGNGHIRAVRNLIENGAKINAIQIGTRPNSRFSIFTTNVTPLYFAAENGQTKTVSTLLDTYDAQNKATALDIAIEKGHKNTVEALLERNAHILNTSNFCTSFHQETPQSETMKLFNAAKNGHTEVVKILLDMGFNPNGTKNFTPLSYAAKNNHTKVTLTLLAYGALILTAAGKNKFQYDSVFLGKLIAYSKELYNRSDDDYKFSFTIFGKKITFGHSALEKKQEITRIVNVLVNGADKNTLHKDITTNGNLGNICRGLRIT